MPRLTLRATGSARAFRLKRLLPLAAFFAAVNILNNAPAAAQHAVAAPSLTINGAAADTLEVDRGGHIFVPAQSVFSKLGEVVTYTAPHAVVKTKNGTELARMTLGSTDASLKGTGQTLPAAPFSAHGTLMVPLRFVSEAAGASVVYSASPRAVSIHNAVPIAAAGAAAVIAQAKPAPQTADTAAAAAPATVAQTDSSGIPWWVWLLAALVLLGLIFAFLRRKKEPLIATRGAQGGAEPTITTRR